MTWIFLPPSVGLLEPPYSLQSMNEEKDSRGSELSLLFQARL
jgi:hypothetical protein